MTDCFYCGLDNYHPTCSGIGCSRDVHGDESGTVNAHCPVCRGEVPEHV